MTATRPISFSAAAVGSALSGAYQRGLGSVLCAGSSAEVQAALGETVRELLATLTILPAPELSEDYWAAALLASAPRIVSHSHPDQTLAFHLVGELDDLPLASHYTQERTWYPHETLLLQRLSPLTPDRLLGLDPPFTAELPLETPVEGTQADPAPETLAPAHPPAHDPYPSTPATPASSDTERTNPALDALFEAL